MNEKALREKLWQKACNEFTDFKNEQINEDKEKIFDNAYKIALLNDFVDMCDPICNCLSLDEVKALLREKYPVHTLYNYYMKTDAGGINELYDAVWYELKDLVKHTKQLQSNRNILDVER